MIKRINEKTTEDKPILVYRVTALNLNKKKVYTCSYPTDIEPLRIADIWFNKGYTNIVINGRAVCNCIGLSMKHYPYSI